MVHGGKQESGLRAGTENVRRSMGRTAEEAYCAVRFSLSHATTEDDIDETIAWLARVLEEMETTVRFLPCK